MSEDEVVKSSRFTGGKERSRWIPFEWPVEFGGTAYSGVMLQRMTAGEVAAWMKEVSALASTGAGLTWPIIRDETGIPVPPGLLDALDADDFDAVNKAMLDFLPQRFRGALPSASGQQAGGTTA